MYSRRGKVEETRNKRKAVGFIILTIIASYFLIFYGIPTVAKLASFLSDFKNTGETPDISDSTPPPPPRIDPLPEATKESEVEVRGKTEPGATVVLTINGDDEEVLANNEGNFNFTLNLKNSLNTITALAKDNSGNESHRTEKISILYDTEVPDLEITKPEEGAQFFGSKQRQIVIEGKTEPESAVNINGRFVALKADGTFAFATTLNEGENILNITSEDLAGNKQEKTLKVSFSL